MAPIHCCMSVTLLEGIHQQDEWQCGGSGGEGRGGER